MLQSTWALRQAQITCACEERFDEGWQKWETAVQAPLSWQFLRHILNGKKPLHFRECSWIVGWRCPIPSKQVTNRAPSSFSLCSWSHCESFHSLCFLLTPRPTAPRAKLQPSFLPIHAFSVCVYFGPFLLDFGSDFTDYSPGWLPASIGNSLL